MKKTTLKKPTFYEYIKSRHNHKRNYLIRKVPIVIRQSGARGITGPTGPTGPIGPTGPQGKQGPKGDCANNVVARTTVCVSPDEVARVESHDVNNTTCLDFYIPRGATGPSPVIEAGNVSSVETEKPAEVLVRYENGIHYLDFSIPKGETGLQGIQGVAGIQGPKGETGPQGIKGQKGDTGLQGPQGQQGVAGPKGDKGETGPAGEIGPQGIQGLTGPQGEKGETGPIGATGPQGEQGPKGEQGEQGPKGDKGETGPQGFPGEIGRSETISIDLTETIEAGEEAQVLDDFENFVHHLTFYIPKGATGPQGEKGDKNEDIILAGNTTLVGENEPAKVEDRYEENVHFFDFQIPQGKTGEKGDRGPAGPQGVQGVTGPAGSTNNINATIYNSINQDIASGRPIIMDEVLTNNGLSLNNSSITVPATGTYIISFSINNGTSASAGDCIGAYCNNQLIFGSRRPLTTSTNVSATVVTNLKINDIITLVPTLSTNRTITSSGAPSAMLTVVQIAT